MLTGTLDDFTLADVLRLIAGAKRSGGLEVVRDGGAGSLYFRDGSVSGGLARYDRRTGPASPAGAIEDLTFDLMRWSRGEFAWTPGATPEGGPGAAGGEAAVEVDDLLREVSGRLEELARIQTLVPSEEAVLAMAPQPPEGAVQINITPAEWRVLVLVDGHRSVAEIAAAAGVDDLEAMKLLYGLAAAGLVAGDESPEATPEAPAAPVDETPASEAMSDMSDTARQNGYRAETPEAPAAEPEPGWNVPAPADEPDPFLADLVEATSPFDGLDALPDLNESPAVDRSTAARELAGLFDDVDPARAQAGPPAPPRVPRRVEDDDQVTRGLISRLIDGVKGL
ncbi:MAG: DUF4388 domain-containing protein [Actinomycetota bacterium]|nr:DUF4388 domain-containing protein [Actinomycetota bacterium]